MDLWDGSDFSCGLSFSLRSMSCAAFWSPVPAKILIVTWDLDTERVFLVKNNRSPFLCLSNKNIIYIYILLFVYRYIWYVFLIFFVKLSDIFFWKNWERHVNWYFKKWLVIIRCCRNPWDLECDASRADRAAHSCLLWSCWWAKAWSAKEGTAAVFGNTCKNLQPLHESSHDAYRTTWRHEHMWEGFERGDMSLGRKITLTNLSAWMLASQDSVPWTPWTTFEKKKWKTTKYWKIRKIHGSMARWCRFLRFETQDMKMVYSDVWCQKDGRRWSVVKFYGLRFLLDIKGHSESCCHTMSYHSFSSCLCWYPSS